MDVLIGCRDNHSLMAIMALPDEWLNLFDIKKSLKAHNTLFWPPVRRAYASEIIRHVYGRNMVTDMGRCRRELNPYLE
jgi:hypothetical protein